MATKARAKEESSLATGANNESLMAAVAGSKEEALLAAGEKKGCHGPQE